MNGNFSITKIVVDNAGEISELEINGKAVALAKDVKFDNKIEETIDVSTYTDPVEITPTTGKDGIKKVVITLSNIPE